MVSWLPTRIVLATLAALLMLPSAVHAQDTNAAREHWQRGRALADEGDWQGARDAFAASLELVPRASTLISLATAEVQLGHGRAALAALDRLEDVADAARDADHLRAAAQLRPRAEAIADDEPEPDVLAEPTPGPERLAESELESELESEPESEREPAEPPADAELHVIGGLATLGGGVLVLIGGGVTYALRADALNERDALCPDAICPSVSDQDRALARHADAATFTDATTGLVVAGSILALGGAAWMFVGLAMGSDAERPEDVAITPSFGPGAIGVHARGRF